MLYTTLP